MMYIHWHPQGNRPNCADIHKEIVLIAQRCKPCTRKGKKLKPVMPKNKHTQLSNLQKPNEEVQMDFTGPIQENSKDSYILLSVDRFSRYPHAKAYHNCDTETAIKNL